MLDYYIENALSLNARIKLGYLLNPDRLTLNDFISSLRIVILELMRRNSGFTQKRKAVERTIAAPRTIEEAPILASIWH